MVLLIKELNCRQLIAIMVSEVHENLCYLIMRCLAPIYTLLERWTSMDNCVKWGNLCFDFVGEFTLSYFFILRFYYHTFCFLKILKLFALLTHSDITNICVRCRFAD